MALTKEQRKQLQELEKRQARKIRLDPDKDLFGPQKDFVLDKSHLKAATCSRRAGKSYGTAFMLATAALEHPRSVCPYITQTRETAKDIIHPAFFDLDRKYGLNLKFRENSGDVVFPNGSKVILRGASTVREVEKLRGPKYPLCIIDEAQGFPAYILDSLVDEVLEPATLDYKGQIVATGTPNAACAGPFKDIVHHGMGWKVHNWTLRDNPHLPDVNTWLNTLCERRGWSKDTPAFLREYCGIWVRDLEGLVFEYNPKINQVDTFDEHAANWEYVLGIDLGFNDPTAFVVLAFSEALEKAYVVESYKESGLIPSAVAAHTERLMSRYKFCKIVADTGGFGKGYAEEMKAKYGIPVAAASKRNKNTFISYLNSDFKTGSLVICTDRNKELLGELQLLQWDMSSVDSGNPKVDDQRFEDHLADALLYGWRECFHHPIDRKDQKVVLPGSTEWWRKQEEEMWDSYEKDLRSSEEEAFWERGFGSIE